MGIMHLCRCRELWDGRHRALRSLYSLTPNGAVGSATLRYRSDRGLSSLNGSMFKNMKDGNKRVDNYVVVLSREFYLAGRMSEQGFDGIELRPCE